MTVPADAGVLVGLEVHQQLATGRKLFCHCPPTDSAEYASRFQRRLGAARGELGAVDRAALFEGSKSRTMEYYADPRNSCLVERDEEPPHGLDPEARGIALVIASALGSRAFDEVYPMRKTVVDGSNTAGFQRTMLVSRGGSFEAGDKKIGIQSVCLEEDAARTIGGEGSVKKYGLERLGVPLVEIATDPFEAGSGGIRDVALALGRILRSTRMVRRGIGTIRQDVNVSVRGGGAVIEVKGVQQLDQLDGVVEYEAKRQLGMMQMSAEIKKSGWRHDPGDMRDVTDALRDSGSKVVAGAIKKGHAVLAVSFAGMAGIFGHSPYEGVRLGRDVAELARVLGLGGVFHSDELPGYGITEDDVVRLRAALGLADGDAFLLLAGPGDRVEMIARELVGRIESIRDSGVQADTRMATRDGETRFLRPKPGAARMYPETDVPPLIITRDELEEARARVPRSWDDSIAELQKLGLNGQLAEQVFDSPYAELFERLAASGADPAFAASSLCSTITSLERDGLDASLLGEAEIAKTFELLNQKKIAKESVEIIFAAIMGGKASTVEDAMKAESIEAVGEGELEGIIEGIVQNHLDLVKRQGERAAGPLMGVAMKELRGRAPGEAVSRMLLESIKKRM